MSHEENNDSDMTNKTIGPFVLKEKIGQGAFSSVYKAEHIDTKELVAIKYIKKATILSSHHTSLDILSSEINNQKKLFHNNIAKIYCTIETNSTISIATEYCGNGDLLSHIIEKGKFTENDACKIFWQIINALEYMHSMCIAHRDLKPENILFDYNNDVKLCDFGLSKDYSIENIMSTPCGSPIYAAPEMVMNRPYNGSNVDIWSAGVTLFTMVAGYLPFDDEDMQQLFYKIAKGIYTVPSFISKSCKELIERMLTVDSAQRATFDEIKKSQWMQENESVIWGGGIFVDRDVIPVDEEAVIDIIERNEGKITVEDVVKGIIMNKHNKITTTYYLTVKRRIKEGKESYADFSWRSEKFKKYMEMNESKKEFYEGRIQKVIDFIVDKIKKKIEERVESELESEEDENDDDDFENNEEKILMTDIVIETQQSLVEEKKYTKHDERILLLPFGEITKDDNIINNDTQNNIDPAIPAENKNNEENKNENNLNVINKKYKKLPSNNSQKAHQPKQKKKIIPNLKLDLPKTKKTSNKNKSFILNTNSTDGRNSKKTKQNCPKQKIFHKRNQSLQITTNANISTVQNDIKAKKRIQHLSIETISSSNKKTVKYNPSNKNVFYPASVTRITNHPQKPIEKSRQKKQNSNISNILHYQKITHNIKKQPRNVQRGKDRINELSSTQSKNKKHALNTSVVSARTNTSRFNTPEPNKKFKFNKSSAHQNASQESLNIKPNVIDTVSSSTCSGIKLSTNTTSKKPILKKKKVITKQKQRCLSQPHLTQPNEEKPKNVLVLTTKKPLNSIHREISSVVGFKNVSYSQNRNHFNIKYETKVSKIGFSLEIKKEGKQIKLIPKLNTGGQYTYQIILNKIKIRLI